MVLPIAQNLKLLGSDGASSLLYQFALMKAAGSEVNGAENWHELTAGLAAVDGTHSISYAFSPLWLPHESAGSVPRIINQLLPQAKVIFSLCDPVRILTWIYHRERDDTRALRTSRLFTARHDFGSQSLHFHYTSVDSFLTDIAHLDDTCSDESLGSDSQCTYL
jgi:hypothetical protein